MSLKEIGRIQSALILARYYHKPINNKETKRASLLAQKECPSVAYKTGKPPPRLGRVNKM